ncbi:FIST N-terminal domain-containing protein [Aliivibrio logei]|uniref:FIST N-terminal domain-containing protein n=1 Tax=Aliivibrio logei TaxID=688 RepID=UPI0035C8A0E9
MILEKELTEPSIILCYFTEEHNEKIILSLLKKQFPNSKIHGCTSCQGIMTDDGFVSNSVFYPSCKVSYSFHSGYAPFDISGIATKTNKRTLYEIDNRPIVEVYKEWTQMSDLINKDQNLLEHMAQYPLGRVAGLNAILGLVDIFHDSSLSESQIEWLNQMEGSALLLVMY